MRIIASFNSKANNNQSHTIVTQHDKHAIKSNAFIIVMPIEKPRAAEIRRLKVDVKRYKAKQFLDRFDSF